jgi:phosphoribosylaminoimidazolecarboxamide formyltransferase/IMP cyclohydrolase
VRSIAGGLLCQESDTGAIDANTLKHVTDAVPDGGQVQDLFFAFRVAKHVKSNAIVFARDVRSLGIGAGQMSRIDSVRIARQKAADAGLDLHGSVLASDAFFPFRDGVDAAVDAGVVAVIQPGGSKRDNEAIAAADAAGVAMLFTGMRHFRH